MTDTIEITLCCTYTNLLIRQMSSFSCALAPFGISVLVFFFSVVFHVSVRLNSCYAGRAHKSMRYAVAEC